MSNSKHKRGMALQTLLIGAVLSVLALGTLVQYRLRRSASRSLQGAFARRQALTVAESAIEEATFRILYPKRGRIPLSPGRRVATTVESAETRRLFGGRKGLLQFEVGSARLTQVGTLKENDDGSATGTCDITLEVVASTAGLLGPRFGRRVVRRFRLQVNRVYWDDGGTRRVLFEQARIVPGALAQWVVSHG